MIILGLTGGIAMGKTTVAKQFAACGAKIISADAIVHGLLGEGGAAVEHVAKAFPATLEKAKICRKKLGKAVFDDPAALLTLERILHPLVVKAENEWLDEQRRLGARLAVMDIPLLFETGAEKRCDYTVTVSAPVFVQRIRALARGIGEARLGAILARQMSDARRQELADFVVHTGLGKAYSFRQVKEIVEQVA